MRSNVISLMIALFLALSLTSCSPRPQTLIIGSWQRYDLKDADQYLFYPTAIQFFKDGTVSIVANSPTFGTGLGMSVAGNYKFVDERHVRIDPSTALLGSVVVEVVVSNDELTLIFPKREVAKYRKAK